MANVVLHIEKHKMNEVRIIEKNIKKDKGVWSFKGKGINYINYIDGRIKQLNLQKTVRKDAVAMVSVLVTTEKSFFDDLKKCYGEVKIKTFFRECYQLLADRYGGYDGINIISCTVYKGDNWKMYFCFVPATADNRLSARSVLSPHEIWYLHRAFDDEIWTPWGVSEIELHKETVNLEKEKGKLEKEKADLEKENGKIRNENNQIRNENSALNAENIRLDTENEKIKTHLAELEKKSNQIRNENSQLKLEKIRLCTENENGTNAVQNLKKYFKKLKNEVAEAESELINIKNSLSQDQIQEKILKDDIANLVKKKEALKLELKEMKTSLRFQHVLKEIAKK